MYIQKYTYFYFVNTQHIKFRNNKIIVYLSSYKILYLKLKYFELSFPEASLGIIMTLLEIKLYTHW